MSVSRSAACLVLALMVATSAISGSLSSASNAKACSLVGFGSYLLPSVLEHSNVVAVGRLKDASQTRISLDVEQGLKGVTGERLTLTNRQDGLGSNCFMYIRPNDPGWALPEEEHVIAFLAPDISDEAGVWGPAMPQAYVFPITSDDHRPFGSRGDELIIKIEDVRGVLAGSRNVAFEPGLEKIPPCNPGWFDPAALPGYARMSAVIAIGTVTEVEGAVAFVSTEEVIRGDVGPTFRVNGRFFHQEGRCDLTDSGGNRFAPGMRLMFFLYPDEFGVAEWRPAHWGEALLHLNGDWVAHGLPNLNDVRSLLASGVGTEPPSTRWPAVPTTVPPAPVGRVAELPPVPLQDASPAVPQREMEDESRESPLVWATLCFITLATAGAVLLLGRQTRIR